MKSGLVAIVGKANVGKSSLINALVGEKVSIVSPKAQTTRDKIMGILTTEDYQIIFVDTPGIHKPKSELGEYMMKSVSSATQDVDVIIVVIDGTKRLTDSETDMIEKYLATKIPVYIVVNKTDLIGYEVLYPILNKLSRYVASDSEVEGTARAEEIIPTSCRNKENVETLKKFILKHIPEGDKLFPDDDITDKSERFMITELVREKALLYLQDEVPHGIGVALQSMKFEKGVAKIEIDIVCEKDTHKAIVIGHEGATLKLIGEKARIEIEKMLGKKAFLKIFVKVRDNWRDSKNYMSDIGYNKSNI